MQERSYLQENKNKKGRRRNPTSSKYQTMKSLGQVRCFEERTLPQLRHFKPYYKVLESRRRFTFLQVSSSNNNSR